MHAILCLSVCTWLYYFYLWWIHCVWSKFSNFQVFCDCLNNNSKLPSPRKEASFSVVHLSSQEMSFQGDQNLSLNQKKENLKNFSLIILKYEILVDDSECISNLYKDWIVCRHESRGEGEMWHFFYIWVHYFKSRVKN